MLDYYVVMKNKVVYIFINNIFKKLRSDEFRKQYLRLAYVKVGPSKEHSQQSAQSATIYRT